MPTQTALQTDPQSAKPRAIISLQVILEELKALFVWWYIEVPTWYAGFIKRVLTLCDDTLSMSLLFKTFFVPFHRDSSMLGHAFGIVIRILYLPLAFIITAIVLVVLLIIAVLWVLLPIISALSIVRTPFV